ncbi:GatB/YqeY domain-containing protein [Patescibacteria group bacterium]|nr:GatB/YqeY domain-containing protein [Patescibacteria group bacterium]
MSLHAKLKDDMKVAMKEKNATTLSVIRMVLASITNKAIELGHELEDADIMAVIKSDAKKIQDSFESFSQNAREDLATKAKEELDIIKKYLPEQITDGELEKIVREKLTELSVNAKEQAGKAIGVIMKELQGKADGSRVKKMIDDILK